MLRQGSERVFALTALWAFLTTLATAAPLLDEQFPAPQYGGPWTFSLPASDGRLIFKLSNPDGSADGILSLTNKTREATGADYACGGGMFYGTADEPIYPGVSVSQGAEEIWYALPVRSEWGDCDYEVRYANHLGDAPAGTDRFEMWYSPDPLTTAGAQKKLSLVSQPQEANSASVTFDAGDGGTLLLDMVQNGDPGGHYSGGYHSLYVDDQGVHYANVGSDTQMTGLYKAIQVGPGEQTITLQHEDDGWSDNVGVRQTDVYFSPEKLSDPTPRPPRLHAVVIGTEYPDGLRGDLDAEAFWNVLALDPYFDDESSLLVRLDATNDPVHNAQLMRAALNFTFDRVQAGDTLLVYLSGHGATIPVDTNDPKTFDEDGHSIQDESYLIGVIAGDGEEDGLLSNLVYRLSGQAASLRTPSAYSTPSRTSGMSAEPFSARQ